MNTSYICDNISLNSSCNKKCFRRKWWRKPKPAFQIHDFLSENHAHYEIVWKNLVQPDGPQVTLKYDAFALDVG